MRYGLETTETGLSKQPYHYAIESGRHGGSVGGIYSQQQHCHRWVHRRAAAHHKPLAGDEFWGIIQKRAGECNE